MTRTLCLLLILLSIATISTFASNYSPSIMGRSSKIQKVDTESWLNSSDRQRLNRAQKVYISYKLLSLKTNAEELENSKLYQRVRKEIFTGTLENYMDWMNALSFTQKEYDLSNLVLVQVLQDRWVEKFFSHIGNHTSDFFGTSETLGPAATLLSGLLVYMSVTKTIRGDMSALRNGIQKGRALKLAKEGIGSLRKMTGLGGRVGLTRTGYVGAGAKDSKKEKDKSKVLSELRIPIPPATALLSSHEIDSVGLSYNESRFHNTIYGLFGGLVAYNIFITYAEKSFAYYRFRTIETMRNRAIIKKVPLRILRFPLLKIGGAVLLATLADKGIVTYLDYRKLVKMERSIKRAQTSLQESGAAKNETLTFYAYATAMKHYSEFTYKEFWNNYTAHTSDFHNKYYCDMWDEEFVPSKAAASAEQKYWASYQASFIKERLNIAQSANTYELLLGEINKKIEDVSPAHQNYIKVIEREVSERQKLTNRDYLDEITTMNIKHIQSNINSLFKGANRLDWHDHMKTAEVIGCKNYHSYINKSADIYMRKLIGRRHYPIIHLDRNGI